MDSEAAPSSGSAPSLVGVSQAGAAGPARLTRAAIGGDRRRLRRAWSLEAIKEHQGGQYVTVAGPAGLALLDLNRPTLSTRRRM